MSAYTAHPRVKGQRCSEVAPGVKWLVAPHWACAASCQLHVNNQQSSGSIQLSVAKGQQVQGVM